MTNFHLMLPMQGLYINYRGDQYVIWSYQHGIIGAIGFMLCYQGVQHWTVFFFEKLCQVQNQCLLSARNFTVYLGNKKVQRWLKNLCINTTFKYLFIYFNSVLLLRAWYFVVKFKIRYGLLFRTMKYYLFWTIYIYYVTCMILCGNMKSDISM